MEVGHLELARVKGKPDAYVGEVDVAMVAQGEVCLIAVADKRSDKGPDYQVKFRPDKQSEWAVMGGAWKKELKAGGFFFSVTIDHPMIPAPLYLSAFPDEDQPKEAKDAVFYTLKWKRFRQKAAAQGVTRQQPLNDEIPY